MTASVDKTTMIRAAHPHEIRLLPQIENAADARYARVGLKRVVGFALMEIKGGTAWIEQLSVLDRW